MENKQEELKSAEANHDYGFASIVSEIMDRHDVSCPLETKACYTEINNAFDSKLKEKDNQINSLKNENAQLLFDTMKDESIGFQSEIIDLQKQLKEKELNYGLQEIELNNTKKLLDSCEKALEERDLKLKEKEEEIEDLKRSKGLWEFAYNTEKQNYSRLSILLEDNNNELTKSNEMAERLLKLIPSDEDIEKLGEKWLGGKFNYATYDAHLTGFIEGQKQLRSKFLTEYQNSKK